VDHQPAEVFKYGGKDLHVHLHAFIYEIWSACRVPQQTKDATSIVAIYKTKVTASTVVTAVCSSSICFLEQFLESTG